METSAKLYAFNFAEAKTYLWAAIFVACNMVLPQLCHLIPQGGIIFAPLSFVILAGAYKFGWKTGVLAAVLSSNGDMPIEPDVCMAGEVGLSGEIRPVARIEQRIAEAQKLGFRRILIPKHNMKGLNPKQYEIELVAVRRVVEAVRELFG